MTKHDDTHLILGACICTCVECSENGRCICRECAHNDVSFTDSVEGGTLGSPAARYIRALAPKDAAIVRCTCGDPTCDQQWHDLEFQESPEQREAWDAWIATNPTPEDMSNFLDGLRYDIQLNKDHHQCLECDAQVTSVTFDGENKPCGHRAGTLVTPKAEGQS